MNTTEPHKTRLGRASCALNMLESWRQIQRIANPAIAPIARRRCDDDPD
jgi:hypothetical protein